MPSERLTASQKKWLAIKADPSLLEEWKRRCREAARKRSKAKANARGGQHGSRASQYRCRNCPRPRSEHLHGYVCPIINDGTKTAPSAPLAKIVPHPDAQK